MTNLEKLEKDIREKLPRLEFRTEYSAILNDVLEWLGINEDTFKCHKINSQGVISKVYEYTTWEESNIVGKWDLSKPYLKDQPQELIDYLASLI